jgi:phage terminase large subunit-like protein
MSYSRTDGLRICQHRDRLARLREKYVWDEEAAGRAVRFIEKNLRHWKAPHTGKPFLLSAWQRDDIIKPLFGLKDHNGNRIFRRAYIRIPRKNGKSALAAAIMLLILCTDEGSGHELYTAATKRDQAKIVFNDCVQFIRASPKLRARLRVYAQKISYPDKASVLMPLSSDYNNLDGLNTSAAVVDELHAHTGPHLYDVIQTSTGSRSQPLLLAITTAGESETGVCYREDEYATRILDGVVEDDSYFAYIAEADASLKWNAPDAYRQANPNLGVSISEEYLDAELKRAQEIPSYRRTYERYHLNRWTPGGSSAWLSLAAWKKNQHRYAVEDMRGATAYGGLDLASTTDLAAFSLAIPWEERVRMVTMYFVPESTILERSEADKVPYDVWAQQGWIIPTPGNVIDYSVIIDYINSLRKVLNIRAVAYDTWNAVSVYTQLQKDGLEMFEFIQGVKSFHPPSYEFEKGILEGTIINDGNPVTAWQVGHVKVSSDASGKIRPVKDHKSDKKRIDGIVAMIMALDCKTRLVEVPPVNTDVLERFRALLGA